MKKVILKDLDTRPEQIFNYEYRKNGETFDMYENGRLFLKGLSETEVLNDMELAKEQNYEVTVF